MKTYPTPLPLVGGPANLNAVASYRSRKHNDTVIVARDAEAGYRHFKASCMTCVGITGTLRHP